MLSHETVDQGRTGAKRQSWRKGHVRDVLAKVVDDNPTAKEDEIGEKCWHIFNGNVEQLRTIFEYWFANNYRSLVTVKPSTAEVRDKTAERVAVLKRQHDEVVDRKIRQEVKTLLMIMLPIGKTVRDATREELTGHSNVLSRWASLLKPGQSINEARLSLGQLEAAYLGTAV